MKTKLLLYTIILVTSLISLFYLLGISFIMYFGKTKRIEIDTKIENQLMINYIGLFLLFMIFVFSIYKILKHEK